MKYKIVEGMKVAVEGDVVISGVRHFVVGGFVSCNPAMNSQAWNTSAEISVCPLCYPDHEQSTTRQMMLFQELT